MVRHKCAPRKGGMRSARIASRDLVVLLLYSMWSLRRVTDMSPKPAAMAIAALYSFSLNS